MGAQVYLRKYGDFGISWLVPITLTGRWKISKKLGHTALYVERYQLFGLLRKWEHSSNIEIHPAPEVFVNECGGAQ
jgi:hypothetical protein